MEKLRTYLNGRTTLEQALFAARCGTTIGYLRRCLSIRRQVSLELASAIERESSGFVRVEDLRPDIDIAHLRARPRGRRQNAA